MPAMGFTGSSIRILSPAEWLKEPSQRYLYARPGLPQYAHLMVDEVTRGITRVTEVVAQYVEKRLTGFHLPARPDGNSPYTLAANG